MGGVKQNVECLVEKYNMICSGQFETPLHRNSIYKECGVFHLELQSAYLLTGDDCGKFEKVFKKVFWRGVSVTQEKPSKKQFLMRDGLLNHMYFSRSQFCCSNRRFFSSRRRLVDYRTTQKVCRICLWKCVIPTFMGNACSGKCCSSSWLFMLM